MLHPIRWTRSWDLWRQPPTSQLYLLAVDALAATAVVTTFLTASPPTSTQWSFAAILAVGIGIHLRVAWAQEERRRAGADIGPHIDLTSVWTYGAVIVLPPLLAILITLGVRAAMYPIARRPLHRYAFTTSTVLAACLASAVVLRVLGHSMLALLTGGAVYEIVGAAAVAGAFHITLDVPWREALGGTADNLLEAATLVAAATLARAAFVMTPYRPSGWQDWSSSLAVIVVVSFLLAAMNRALDEYRHGHQQAGIDSKTGLRNTRGWERVAAAALTRTMHDHTPAALMMLDLDHFKRVNDTWGHPAGDDVLIAVANLLAEHIRPSDVAARFGGEEIQVLLPGANWPEAEARAEQIRAAVADLRVATTDKTGAPVVLDGLTVSIGITIITEPDPETANPTNASLMQTTLHHALQTADRAVYCAKETGRNRVIRSDRLPVI
jgi:diguanylate cyclase (GGDEF)-like protein